MVPSARRCSPLTATVRRRSRLTGVESRRWTMVKKKQARTAPLAAIASRSECRPREFTHQPGSWCEQAWLHKWGLSGVGSQHGPAARCFRPAATSPAVALLTSTEMKHPLRHRYKQRPQRQRFGFAPATLAFCPVVYETEGHRFESCQARSAVLRAMPRFSRRRARSSAFGGNGVPEPSFRFRGVPRGRGRILVSFSERE
jgi:hypothetical protein